MKTPVMPCLIHLGTECVLSWVEDTFEPTYCHLETFTGLSNRHVGEVASFTFGSM